jgi:hypothetical protein
VRILPYLRSGQGKIFIFFENILHNLVFLKIFCTKLFFIHNFFLQEKVRIFFAYRDSKTARIRSQIQNNINWSNPPEIRQKLGVRQKYFLPARQLSNPPELSKSVGENRHPAPL